MQSHSNVWVIRMVCQINNHRILHIKNGFHHTGCPTAVCCSLNGIRRYGKVTHNIPNPQIWFDKSAPNPQIYIGIYAPNPQILTILFGDWVEKSSGSLLFFAFMFWQEGRIEQCRVSDIKYHYILMNGGVGPEGLDSIESWFNNPKLVKQIEAEVRAHEERVQETARTLEQKHRLEEKLNELNKAE